MNTRIPLIACLGLAAATLAACSSSPTTAAAKAGTAPTGTTGRTASSTPPADVPTVAPVSTCTQVDAKPLDAAFLASTWTAGAPVKTGGTCVTTVTAAADGGTITLTLAPTGDPAGTVTSFRASPPPLKGRVSLNDLGVTVPSAGIYASGTGGSVNYLLVAAEPSLSISVQASLNASIQGAVAPVTAADDIASWAVAQKL